MPAQILHTLFGETALAGLPFRRKPEDRAVFALGCQGPDIFYHSRMSKPVALEYGTLLHRRNFGTFTSILLARALPLKETLAPAGAYALGFMTHAVLDRLCHPYIVYQSDAAGDTQDTAERFAGVFRNSTAHAFFERILDALMLEFLQGTSVAAWDQNALARVCAEPPPEIKKLLYAALQEAFPERAGKDSKLAQRIDNAFTDSAVFYYFTAPQITARYRYPAELKKDSPLRQMALAYLYPERLPLHIDYLNLARRPWFYPAGTGPEDTRSFLDVYRGAAQTAVSAFSSFLIPYWETGIFPRELAAQRLGDGGLSIQDETGRPCGPVKTSVLPLDKVLLQQKNLRESYAEGTA
jgi:hypothetical protein